MVETHDRFGSGRQSSNLAIVFLLVMIKPNLEAARCAHVSAFQALVQIVQGQDWPKMEKPGQAPKVGPRRFPGDQAPTFKFNC